MTKKFKLTAENTEKQVNIYTFNGLVVATDNYRGKDKQVKRNNGFLTQMYKLAYNYEPIELIYTDDTKKTLTVKSGNTRLLTAFELITTGVVIESVWNDQATKEEVKLDSFELHYTILDEVLQGHDLTLAQVSKNTHNSDQQELSPEIISEMLNDGLTAEEIMLKSNYAVDLSKIANASKLFEPIEEAIKTVPSFKGVLDYDHKQTSDKNKVITVNFLRALVTRKNLALKKVFLTKEYLEWAIKKIDFSMDSDTEIRKILRSTISIKGLTDYQNKDKDKNKISPKADKEKEEREKKINEALTVELPKPDASKPKKVKEIKKDNTKELLINLRDSIEGMSKEDIHSILCVIIDQL